MQRGCVVRVIKDFFTFQENELSVCKGQILQVHDVLDRHWLQVELPLSPNLKSEKHQRRRKMGRVPSSQVIQVVVVSSFIHQQQKSGVRAKLTSQEFSTLFVVVEDCEGKIVSVNENEKTAAAVHIKTNQLILCHEEVNDNVYISGYLIDGEQSFFVNSSAPSSSLFCSNIPISSLHRLLPFENSRDSKTSDFTHSPLLNSFSDVISIDLSIEEKNSTENDIVEKVKQSGYLFICKVCESLKAQIENEIDLNKGDFVKVFQILDNGEFYRGQVVGQRSIGTFPSSFVTKIDRSEMNNSACDYSHFRDVMKSKMDFDRNPPEYMNTRNEFSTFESDLRLLGQQNLMSRVTGQLLNFEKREKGNELTDGLSFNDSSIASTLHPIYKEDEYFRRNMPASIYEPKTDDSERHPMQSASSITEKDINNSLTLNSSDPFDVMLLYKSESKRSPNQTGNEDVDENLKNCPTVEIGNSSCLLRSDYEKTQNVENTTFKEELQDVVKFNFLTEVRKDKDKIDNVSTGGYSTLDVNVKAYGIAKYKFTSLFDNELNLDVNDLVYLVRYVDQDWVEGYKEQGADIILENNIASISGIFPIAYIDVIVDILDRYENASTCTSSNATTKISTNSSSQTNEPKIEKLEKIEKFTLKGDTSYHSVLHDYWADDVQDGRKISHHNNSSNITVVKGEIVKIIHDDDNSAKNKMFVEKSADWTFVENSDGCLGYVPTSYINFVNTESDGQFVFESIQRLTSYKRRRISQQDFSSKSKMVNSSSTVRLFDPLMNDLDDSNNDPENLTKSSHENKAVIKKREPPPLPNKNLEIKPKRMLPQTDRSVDSLIQSNLTKLGILETHVGINIPLHVQNRCLNDAKDAKFSISTLVKEELFGKEHDVENTETRDSDIANVSCFEKHELSNEICVKGISIQKMIDVSHSKETKSQQLSKEMSIKCNNIIDLTDKDSVQLEASISPTEMDKVECIEKREENASDKVLPQFFQNISIGDVKTVLPEQIDFILPERSDQFESSSEIQRNDFDDSDRESIRFPPCVVVGNTTALSCLSPYEGCETEDAQRRVSNSSMTSLDSLYARINHNRREGEIEKSAELIDNKIVDCLNDRCLDDSVGSEERIAGDEMSFYHALSRNSDVDHINNDINHGIIDTSNDQEKVTINPCRPAPPPPHQINIDLRQSSNGICSVGGGRVRKSYTSTCYEDDFESIEAEGEIASGSEPENLSWDNPDSTIFYDNDDEILHSTEERQKAVRLKKIESYTSQIRVKERLLEDNLLRELEMYQEIAVAKEPHYTRLNRVMDSCQSSIESLTSEIQRLQALLLEEELKLDEDYMYHVRKEQKMEREKEQGISDKIEAKRNKLLRKVTQNRLNAYKVIEELYESERQYQSDINNLCDLINELIALVFTQSSSITSDCSSTLTLRHQPHKLVVSSLAQICQFLSNTLSPLSGKLIQFFDANSEVLILNTRSLT